MRKVRCIGGPLDDSKVSSTLGNRWPYCLAFDDDEMVLGYYEIKLDGTVASYYWTGERETIPREEKIHLTVPLI